MMKEQKNNSDKEQARLHYEHGRALWAAGDRGAAMSEYSKAVLLDPESPAATALEMARNIMDFYDRSRYNP